MSANSTGAAASASAAPQARDVPRAVVPMPRPKVAAIDGGDQVKAAVPKVELKAPEKPALRLDVVEKQRNLEEAIQRLNDQMRSNNRDLAFAIDRKVDRTIITVRSAQTGEVVRQIPDEAVLRVAHSIEDIKGLLLNATA